MDRAIVKYSHCARSVYRFPFSPSGAEEGDVCPVCSERLRFGLLGAPVAVPSPFIVAHAAPCAFVVGSVHGPYFLGEWNDTELHVGITNSRGLVHNYTISGIRKDQCGWEQCVCVPLLQPGTDRRTALWDKELEEFSSLSTWVPERFHEEKEFGSCCYGFALSFINHMRALDGKKSFSRDEFTSSYVLPKVKMASDYIRVYLEILQHGFYISANPNV
ncbi:MKRN2 opposite strand, tandem duplicate 1 isoform X2 [Denticeps clupeoides]|uniref:MKRN2 opposite strand protein-like C-terminal domain-containing protein n=1 Tax=Denticeps clupeoides TaxID=299321 RepID=A0AAY4DG39_9TELE|nr:MKRN2 opposite strand protein-like isoform X2 [Denticeps clupeoides]